MGLERMRSLTLIPHKASRSLFHLKICTIQSELKNNIYVEDSLVYVQPQRNEHNELKL